MYINAKLFKTKPAVVRRNETYIPTTLGYTTVDVNQLYCDANLNFRIDTAVSANNIVLFSGLPEPKKRITLSAVVNTTAVRFTLNENGELTNDMALPTGWTSIHVFYIIK